MIELLSLIALLLLSMVGYASGLVLVSGGRTPALGLPDLGGQVGVWTGGLVVRLLLGKWWALGAGLVLGLLTGLALGMLIPDRDELRLEGETGFFRAMGNVQARIVMACLYFVLLPTFSLLARIAGDPLDLRGTRGDGTLWRSRDPGPRDEAEARRQW